MTEQEKIAYMSGIFRQAHIYFEDGQWGSAEAYISNFEAKIALGWPDPRKIVGFG